MPDLTNALQITLLGMGMTFGAILLLWLLMVLLVRVAPEQPAAEAPEAPVAIVAPATADDGERARRQRAAAVAVAIALAGARQPPAAAPSQGASVSAWQAVNRSHHLRHRGRRRS